MGARSAERGPMTIMGAGFGPLVSSRMRSQVVRRSTIVCCEWIRRTRSPKVSRKILIS